jgi:hypothetical protein
VEAQVSQAGHPYAGVDEDTDSRVITAGLEVLASGGLQQSRQLGIREEGLGLSGDLRLLNPESRGALEAGVP